MTKRYKNRGGSILADLIVPAVFVYTNNTLKRTKRAKNSRRKTVRNKTRFRKRK